MTTSDRPGRIQASNSTDPREAFVWVWLPTATEPVVAGRLDVNGEMTLFTYGRSYVERTDAIALYAPELPLQRGPIRPGAGFAGRMH